MAPSRKALELELLDVLEELVEEGVGVRQLADEDPPVAIAGKVPHRRYSFRPALLDCARVLTVAC